MRDAACDSGRKRWAMLLVVGVVALFWLVRIVLPTKPYTFGSIDPYLLFLPTYEVAYRWLASGTLPLWNPYVLCGIPWLATLQGGFFYPSHVLYLVLPGPLAMAASGLLHLVFAALTTVWFARQAGLGSAAALLAAVLFALRGILPNLVYCPPQLEAAAWLPLGSVAVLRLAREGGRRPVGLLGLAAAASFLAGYPQTTTYVVYAWAALLVALLLGERAGPRRWIATWVLFAGGLVLGVLAAAVQLFPALEMTQAGTRAVRQLDLRAMFPFGGSLGGSSALPFLAREAITGSRFSFGVVGLALVPAALVARRFRPLVLWALVLGALTVAFALGPLTPLFSLYLALPAVAWFRAPSRMLLVTEFCFAFLAATGLEALGSTNAGDAGAAAYRQGPGAAVLALIGLAAVMVLVFAGRATAGSGHPALAVGAATAAVLLAGASGGHQRRRRHVAVTVVALAALEPFLAPPPDARLPYHASTDALYRKHSAAFARLAALTGPARVWVFNREAVPEVAAKFATLSGVRSIDDYEQVNLRRQSDYFTYFAEGSTEMSREPWVFGGLVSLDGARNAARPATRRRLLDLSAVRFLVLQEASLRRAEVREFLEAAGLAPQSSLPGEEPTSGEDRLVLFENPRVLPRAYVVYRTRPAPPADELLGRMSQESFDPLVESYVEGDPGFIPAPDAPARGIAAEILRDDPRVVELRATAAAPGLAVLADTFYAGWQADVDGRPASVVATNHLFRGVPVPAGMHRVRFEYRPASARVGTAATGFALVALAALLRRPRQGAPRRSGT